VRQTTRQDMNDYRLESDPYPRREENGSAHLEFYEEKKRPCWDEFHDIKSMSKILQFTTTGCKQT